MSVHARASMASPLLHTACGIPARRVRRGCLTTPHPDRVTCDACLRTLEPDPMTDRPNLPTHAHFNPASLDSPSDSKALRRSCESGAEPPALFVPATGVVSDVLSFLGSHTKLGADRRYRPMFGSLWSLTVAQLVERVVLRLSGGMGASLVGTLSQGADVDFETFVGRKLASNDDLYGRMLRNLPLDTAEELSIEHRGVYEKRLASLGIHGREAQAVRRHAWDVAREQLTTLLRCAYDTGVAWGEELYVQDGTHNTVDDELVSPFGWAADTLFVHGAVPPPGVFPRQVGEPLEEGALETTEANSADLDRCWSDETSCLATCTGMTFALLGVARCGTEMDRALESAAFLALEAWHLGTVETVRQLSIPF